MGVGDGVRWPELPAVTVAFGPEKGDRKEAAVEKMVEIGVGRIVVLAPTEHSVVRWDAARAVMLTAVATSSGDATLPRLSAECAARRSATARRSPCGWCV